MFLVIFGCKLLGFKNPASVKEMTNMSHALKSDLGVFWPFRATDFIMGILKIWDNFLGPQLPILKFTFLESLRNL